MFDKLELPVIDNDDEGDRSDNNKTLNDDDDLVFESDESIIWEGDGEYDNGVDNRDWIENDDADADNNSDREGNERNDDGTNGTIRLPQMLNWGRRRKPEQVEADRRPQTGAPPAGPSNAVQSTTAPPPGPSNTAQRTTASRATTTRTTPVLTR